MLVKDDEIWCGRHDESWDTANVPRTPDSVLTSNVDRAANTLDETVDSVNESLQIRATPQFSQ
jgi:hypothetical protein